MTSILQKRNPRFGRALGALAPGPHSLLSVQPEIQTTPRLMLVMWPYQAMSCESDYEGDILHCSEPSARLGVIRRLGSRSWWDLGMRCFEATCLHSWCVSIRASATIWLRSSERLVKSELILEEFPSVLSS